MRLKPSVENRSASTLVPQDAEAVAGREDSPRPESRSPVQLLRQRNRARRCGLSTTHRAEARGDHARVGYLSLNRGEGGQNTISRGTLGGELAPVQAAVDGALASRKPFARSDTIPPLTEGLTALRTAEARVPSLAFDDPLVIVPVSPRLTERVAALLKE